MSSNAVQIEEYNKICDFLDSQSLFHLEPDPRRWRFLRADVLYHAFVLQAEFWCSTPYVLAAVLRNEPVERLYLVRRLVISFDGCDAPVSHSPYLDWLLNNLPNLESVQLRDSTRSFADDYLTFFHGKPPEPVMNDLNAHCRRATLKELVWKSSIRMMDSFVRFLHTQPGITRLEFNSLYPPSADITFYPGALPNLQVLHCTSCFSTLLLPGRPISHLQVSMSLLVNSNTALFPSCDDTDSVQVLSVGLDQYSIDVFYEFLSHFRNLKTLTVIAPHILNLERLYRLIAVISLTSPNIEFIRLCGPLAPHTSFPPHRIFGPLDSLLAFEYLLDESSGVFRRLFRGNVFHEPPPVFVKWTCGLHNEWLGNWKTDVQQVQVDARHFADVRSAVRGRAGAPSGF